MAEVPADVRLVASALIDLLDARLPGQLEALYLVGSVALGDYRPGQSDIDFIAVLARPHDVATLQWVHAELAQTYPHVHCDGIYVRPDEVSAPPTGSGIEAREGRIDPQSMGERHAVTWLTLADHGIALRGPRCDDGWIAADRSAAIAHSRQNMQSYWRNWLDMRRHLVSVAGVTLLSDEAVTWGALGVARLHATVLTGGVLSKSAAADHARSNFGDHSRIITEALRLRVDPGSRPGYPTPLARRRDLIAFMDRVIDGVTGAGTS